MKDCCGKVFCAFAGVCAIAILTVTIILCFCKEYDESYLCCLGILFLFFFVCMCLLFSIIISNIELYEKIKKEKSQHLSDVFCEMQGIAKVTNENIQKTEKCIESISKKVTDEIKNEITEASKDNDEYKEKMRNISETMCEKVTEIIKEEITDIGEGVIKDCGCCCCCTCEEKTESTNDKMPATTIKKYNCNCPSKFRADMFKAYASAIVEI